MTIARVNFSVALAFYFPAGVHEIGADFEWLHGLLHRVDPEAPLKLIADMRGRPLLIAEFLQDAF